MASLKWRKLLSLLQYPTGPCKWPLPLATRANRVGKNNTEEMLLPYLHQPEWLWQLGEGAACKAQPGTVKDPMLAPLLQCHCVGMSRSFSLNSKKKIVHHGPPTFGKYCLIWRRRNNKNLLRCLSSFNSAQPGWVKSRVSALSFPSKMNALFSAKKYILLFGGNGQCSEMLAVRFGARKVLHILRCSMKAGNSLQLCCPSVTKCTTTGEERSRDTLSV